MSAQKLLLQGTSGLSLFVSHIDYIVGRYSLNLTHGEVVYIGTNIRNLTLSVGDTLDSSPNITSSRTTVSYRHNHFC